MLQDLVNVSRGKAKSPEICRLMDVVNAAHDVIRSSADSHQISISIDVPESIELPLERARMERVFINLMNNAVEAMPEGGHLQINARAEQDAVMVEIDDTGIGISNQLRATLFQPFASFGKKTGLGLGLALSRQTVLDQGGDIWAAEKSGPGARFLMRFPLPAVSKPQVVAPDVAGMARDNH
jgi:two-component system, NtrC family, sensor kinase